MTTYDVFLSHASADKPTVEVLARRLHEDGIEPFLDKWHLIPGEPWQEALEDALESSRTCAVFVGAKLGPWQNEEMRAALDERVRDGASASRRSSSAESTLRRSSSRRRARHSQGYFYKTLQGGKTYRSGRRGPRIPRPMGDLRGAMRCS